MSNNTTAPRSYREIMAANDERAERLASRFEIGDDIEADADRAAWFGMDY